MEILAEFRSYASKLCSMIEDELQESEDVDGNISVNLNSALYYGMVVVSTIGDIMEHIAKEYKPIEVKEDETEQKAKISVSIDQPLPPDKQERLIFLGEFTASLLHDFRIIAEENKLTKRINNTFLTNIEMSMLHMKYNLEFEYDANQQDNEL